VLSGVPVRAYHADVDLRRDTTGSTGTTIHWSGRFEPTIPATGKLLGAVLGRMVRGYARAAAAEAARRSLGG
jgi:hypothetical protein